MPALTTAELNPVADQVRRTPDDQESGGYTQCDFIHDKIDVDAQRSLYHLYKKGGPDRASALQIWAAVENGRLFGIYQQDRKVPALRARDHGKSWWTMIPHGHATVFPEKGEELPAETPLLVYKKSLASHIAALALELRKAWSERPDLTPTSIPGPSLQSCPTIVPATSEDEASSDWETVILEGLKGRCGGSAQVVNPEAITDKCGNSLVVFCENGNWQITFTDVAGNSTKVGECVFAPEAENILETRRGVQSDCITFVRHRTEKRDENTGVDHQRWQHTETDVRKGKGGTTEGWCRTGKKYPYDWEKATNDTCEKEWW